MGGATSCSDEADARSSVGLAFRKLCRTRGRGGLLRRGADAALLSADADAALLRRRRAEKKRRVGVAEMVDNYRTAARCPRHGGGGGGGGGPAQLVVVFYPERDPHDGFDAARHAGAGDFVVLTDASVSRSHDYMK